MAEEMNGQRVDRGGRGWEVRLRSVYVEGESAHRQLSARFVPGEGDFSITQLRMGSQGAPVGREVIVLRGAAVDALEFEGTAVAWMMAALRSDGIERPRLVVRTVEVYQ